MTSRSEFEAMCRKADMAPAMRGAFSLGEIYIADGFTRKPWKNFRKFGVGPADFPSGCYATLWALFRGDEFVCADALFFDPLHNIDIRDRKEARLRAAMERAEQFAADWEKVAKNPISDRQARETEEFFEEMYDAQG